METIRIKDVKPAEYNPRLLTDEAKTRLKESIQTLGCIKPIIVNASNKTIIAGHQRTTVMQEMGITECKAFVLENIKEADEVRFNQFHNKCEYEINEKAPIIRVSGELVEGYNRIANENIEIIKRGTLAMLNNQLCRLLTLYGEFGAPICDKKGNVLISSAYAYATKMTGRDMFVYVLSDEKVKDALKYFSRDYGIFSYAKLKRNTYMQGLAQMSRLRGGKKGKGNSFQSTLYERYVIPYLKGQGKNLRIIDFGAGQMDYANKLKKLGYDILGVEPFHFKNGTRKIDVSGNKRRFLKVCYDLKTRGRYDVVICDSVLNSVDSIEAHDAVVYTCKALCKVGGKIFISGRPLEHIEEIEASKKTFDTKRQYIHFLDENLFSGIYRNGAWFFQKFHDKQRREEILNILGDGKIFCLYDRNSSFQIVATKKDDEDNGTYIKALQFEWNLQLPNGQKYGLQNEIREAYENRLPDY